MSEYQIEMDMTGLLGIERASSMIVHCVNACNPTQLSVPDDLKVGIPPHLPRLLIKGAKDDIIAANLPVQSGAHSCLGGGPWQSINLTGWEVTVVGTLGTLETTALDSLLKLSTILAAAGTSATTVSLAWPRTAAKIVILNGTAIVGCTRNTWEFKGIPGSAWELHDSVVVEQIQAVSPLMLVFRWLPKPDVFKMAWIEHDGHLHLRFENNVVATQEGDDCLGDTDFCGHYHLLTNPIERHPYPVQEVGGGGAPSTGVQCSPLQYQP